MIVKKCLKNYLLGLSNSCMQRYWYFIIILAGVFAMLFVQSRLQGLSDLTLSRISLQKVNIPTRPR